MEKELVNIGLTNYMEENYRTAIDQFSKSLEKSSDNFDALVYRGCSYIKLGDYSSAITDLNHAEKINGNNYEVLYNRAKAYFLNMDNKNGHSDITQAGELSDLSEEQKENISSLASRFA
jgi:tetratricopeptide (TPR) repeat protein